MRPRFDLPEVPDPESLPVYRRSQLAQRNGTDREEIWFAYQGLIYEVTGSRHWRNGVHYQHWSGQDLTDELADAPHGAYVFKRFRVVGRLAE
ncbi:MAG: cytochrome b5 [Bacteroidetes bacterium]|nr:MAG: cytochrome b5 [Bacteroidota bacterium]